jgi:MFS family permease
VAWGWRLAFLLSAVLIGFGLWIRLKLEDTPVFKALQESGDRPEAPIREVFTTHARPLVAAVMSRVAPDVLYALFTVFSITYGTLKMGMDRSEVLIAILIGSACQLGLIPLAGAVSDRINRRLVYGVAAVGGVVWALVFFLLIDTGSFPLLVLGIVIGLAFHSFMYGPQAAFVTEQFSVRLRSTGASLAYTIAGVFGGAMAPLIFTYLLDRTGGWGWILVYVGVVGVVTLVGLALGRNPDSTEEEHYRKIAGNVTPATGSAT